MDKIIHDCKQENLLREMHGDIKGLVVKFGNISNKMDHNDDLMSNHISESSRFRRKIDIIWTGIHVGKWLIGLMLGAGIAWKIIAYTIGGK